MRARERRQGPDGEERKADDGYQPVAPLLLDPSASAVDGTTNSDGDFSCSTIAGGQSSGIIFTIAPKQWTLLLNRFSDFRLPRNGLLALLVPDRQSAPAQGRVGDFSAR